MSASDFESDEHRAYAEECYLRAMREEHGRELRNAVYRREFGPHPLRGPAPLQPWDEDIHVSEYTLDDLNIMSARKHRQHHALQHKLAKQYKAKFKR